MAAEEDNFDIDIYGDGGEDYHQGSPDEEGIKNENVLELSSNQVETDYATQDHSTSLQTASRQELDEDMKLENGHLDAGDRAQKIASTDESAQDAVHLPKQAPQTQGLKRKDGSDDRFVDPGATTAIFISELHWWVTDDDVRGWANQSQCEDELEDITFSEHKVNGKSKGWAPILMIVKSAMIEDELITTGWFRQAYVLFKSPQAATAAKQKIESFGEGQQYTKKFKVNYTNPFTNPFRTLPKDGPTRSNNPPSNTRSTPSGFNNTGGMNSMPQGQVGYNMNHSNNYRGNRSGGHNNRGGMNNMSGYNRGGFQQPMTGGFQGNAMGGFQGTPMGAMSSYGGFQNRGGVMGGMRGGPMGMRGGRGGINPNAMMGMSMGGMGMAGVGPQMNGMGMGMPQMGAAMGMPGMPPSHTYTHTTSGLYPSATPPTARFHNPSQMTGQHQPPSTQASQYPSVTTGGYQPPNVDAAARPVPAPTWETLTQYSAPASSTAPTYFPSQLVTATPSMNAPPLNENSMLNRGASHAGQAGFQGAQAHYNPAFFPQQPQGQQGVGGADSSWNPHGAKRTRQE